MNLFAASVQFWAKPEIIGYISKKDFSPTPKVDSAIIKLTPPNILTSDINILKSTLNVERYYHLIHILFKQPRKTILNNLINADKRGWERGLTRINKEEIIKKLNQLGINPQDRPQNLSLVDLMRLVDKLF